MKETSPRFRLNVQVLQMLGLIAVALALPVALVILGVRSLAPAPNAESADAPDLRASLEKVADHHWKDATVIPERRTVFVFSGKDPSNASAAAEAVLRDMGLSFLAGEGSPPSLICVVPAGLTQTLSERLAEFYFLATSEIAPEGGLVEIRIASP